MRPEFSATGCVPPSASAPTIEQQIVRATPWLRRLSQIAAASRPAPPAPAAPAVPNTNTQSTLAAAQAFVERSRGRSGDLAA